MSDTLAFVLLIGGFALAVTAHLAMVWGLFWLGARGRSFIALIVPPLALYWAYRERMRVRAAAAVIGILVYVVARR